MGCAVTLFLLQTALTPSQGFRRFMSRALIQRSRIELVVPFSAGGATDVIARLVAQLVSNTLGQSVIVQNKAGAMGAIGSEYVARRRPMAIPCWSTAGFIFFAVEVV